MKKVFFIFLLLICPYQHIFSNNTQPVDSLFSTHIESLAVTLDKYATSDDIKVAISGEDRVFISMFEFITEHQFEQQGYTHQPMISKKDLRIIKKWYKKNRKKINPVKVKKYLSLEKELADIYNSIDPNEFLKDDNAIDQIFSRMDSLKMVDTLLK